ncbi:twin-arginine translocase subunit TatC [Acidobacteriota bacterium]
MKKLLSPKDSMSFFEHLSELRSRLIRSIIALILGFLVCWFFRYEIYDFIAAPIYQNLPEGEKLSFIKLHEPFFVYLKVSMLAGVFLVSPYLLCQIWLFIAPGLYPRERRYAAPFILGTTVFFLMGGAFGYKWIFPTICAFFLDQGAQFEQNVTVQEYFSMASRIILALALVFEMPVVIGFLAKFGLVSARFLLSKASYAIVINVVIAALITPTHDPYTLALVAVPMIILYFFSILVAWIFGSSQRTAEEEDDDDDASMQKDK